MINVEDIARIDSAIFETANYFAIFEAGCFVHPATEKTDVAIPMLLREWRAAVRACREGRDGGMHLQRARGAAVCIRDACGAGACIIEPETKTPVTTPRG